MSRATNFLPMLEWNNERMVVLWVKNYTAAFSLFQTNLPDYNLCSWVCATCYLEGTLATSAQHLPPTTPAKGLKKTMTSSAHDVETTKTSSLSAINGAINAAPKLKELDGAAIDVRNPPI